jgi:8-oxo-dGTP pyrophosphatase MutT (NUDIX family)
METIQDYSYGVVPVLKHNGQWLVFILNQISYRSSDDVYWTFPKGHPEGDETPEETALREMREEAGITLCKLDTSKMFEQRYIFIHEGTKVEKYVGYYVGFANQQSFKIQPEEVKEGKWCTFKEAKEKLTHAIAKNLLDEVFEYLNTVIK